MKVPIQPAKFKRLPSGIYKAKLNSYETGLGKYQQNIITFRFEIIEGEVIGNCINGIVNQNSNGKGGKLWQIHKALTGISLDVFDQFEPDKLIEKTCFINVEERGKNNAITEYISADNLADIKRGNSKKKLLRAAYYS